MKKGTTYALLLLMLVFLTKSCVDPLEQQQPQVKTQGDDPALALSLSCLDAGTKAYNPYPDYPKSETNYNETRLKHIDWFVFLNDPTANATNAAAPAVLHGRKTWPNDGIDITQTTLAESVSMSGYVTKFGTAGSAGGYVYVVANLPDSFTHVEDRTADDTNKGGIKYTYTDDQGTHEAYALTYNDLLNKLNVEANFNRYDADGFLPQESFVMTSGVLHFTLTPTNRTATVQADLTRLAAKISIDVDVAFAFDELETIMSGRDTTAVKYTQTWYPDIDNIQIYLVYGNGRSTLLGTPQSYIDKYFFTYNRYQFKKVVHRPEEDNITVDDPFKYHSIVHHEDPSIPSDRTPSEHLFYNISGTPFYTYPLAWTTGEAHAPFIKIILPWTAYDEDHYPNTTLNEHVDHHYITHNAEAPEGTVVTHGGDTIVTVSRAKTTQASAGTKEFYYKISLPMGNDLKLLANHWLKIKLEIAMLGSLSDDLSTELVGQYYVVKWGDIKEETPELTQGRYLGVARHEYTISGIDQLEIPVNSSHNLAARVTGRKAWVNGAWVTTGNKPQNLTTRGSVSPDGRTSVTFTDVLNTTMGANLDCYLMCYTVRIYHADDPNPNNPSLYEDVVIYQYPSIYTDIKPGSPAFVDGYYGNVNGYYGYPGTSTTFNQTVENHNSPYTYSSNGLNVTFATYDNIRENNTRYYRMGNANNPGTITVTAPTGATITGITITYRGNDYDNRPVTYQVEGGSTTSESQTQWNGTASRVVVSMETAAQQNQRNQVRSISVTYTPPPSTGASGTNEGSGANDPSHITTPYGHLARYASTQRNMTVISVSAFSSESKTYSVSLDGVNTLREYLIADPREAAGFTSADLAPYFNGTGTVNWTDVDAAKILIGTTTMSNYIAPRFMVSSRWGRQVYGETSYDNIKKRCATYQEAGYPAGRWRLPTEAEVNFIANLQRYNFIDQLFNNGARYWVSDGHVISINNNAVSVTSGNNGQSSRCVYDLWFWGEDPVTPIDEYHIAP